MEKNKSHGTAIRPGGARYFEGNSSAGNNGYGLNSDAPFSNGVASYPNAPNQPMIVNDNFTEERFAGGSPAPRVEASGKGEKDSIETGGGGGDELNRKAY